MVKIQSYISHVNDIISYKIVWYPSYKATSSAMIKWLYKEGLSRGDNLVPDSSFLS